MAPTFGKTFWRGCTTRASPFYIGYKTSTGGRDSTDAWIAEEEKPGGLLYDNTERNRFTWFIRFLPPHYLQDLQYEALDAMFPSARRVVQPDGSVDFESGPPHVALYDPGLMKAYIGRENVWAHEEFWKHVASRALIEETTHHLMRFLSPADRRVLENLYRLENAKSAGDRMRIVEDYGDQDYFYSSFNEWVAAMFIRATEFEMNLQYAKAGLEEKSVLRKIMEFRRYLRSYFEYLRVNRAYRKELRENPAHQVYLDFMKGGRHDRVKSGEATLQELYPEVFGP